jgi:hypothetical protein
LLVYRHSSIKTKEGTMSFMPVVSAKRMLTAAVFTILSTIANDVQADESSADGRRPSQLWAQLCRVAETDATPKPSWRELLQRFEADDPYAVDWLLQDASEHEAGAWLRGESSDFPSKLARKALAELKHDSEDFQRRLTQLESQPDPSAAEAFQLYSEVCGKRRLERLALLIQSQAQILFVEGWDLNEGRCSHAFPSDYTGMYKNQFRFRPGAKLCVLQMIDSYGTQRVLLEDAGGMIRDPDLSYDGRRVLFSWRKSEPEDDFSLYELDWRSGQVRQITSGDRVADLEGCYLPNGDVVFNSTRCVIAVPCMGHPVLNLYRCDQDGRFLRRLGFDQATTGHPSVLNDGRVVYTRWEYNDRNPVFLQPLLQMNPDGTLQTEFYGGNSSWPTSLYHPRAVPGSTRVLAIASGHHTWQTGPLVLIDRSQGQENGAGLQLLAPRRPLPSQRVDHFPRDREEPLYQHPWPLAEDRCLAGVATFGQPQTSPGGSDPHAAYGLSGRPLPHFGIYYVHFDGARELLVKTPGANLSHPILLAPRRTPPIIPDQVDYTEENGVCFIQDVYMGEGLVGVPRGQARRLRVVALDYRADGIGIVDNVLHGNVLTPVSRNGTWDVKEVLGEAEIEEDGSVLFEVPAQTPVYFQILDNERRLIQSMRSWTTLMPGERLSCVGCHEPQTVAPGPQAGLPMAMSRPPQKLRPFYDVRGGFSFNRHIQPMLDRHCIDCHQGARWTAEGAPDTANDVPVTSNPRSQTADKPFSLLPRVSPPFDGGRQWSDAYLGLVRPRPPFPHLTEEKRFPPLGDQRPDLVCPPDPSGEEAVVAPLARGSARSRLLAVLDAGHEGVELSQEDLDKLACWIDLGIPYCGDYREANAWTNQQQAQYEYHLSKRQHLREVEQRSIEAVLEVSTPPR